MKENQQKRRRMGNNSEGIEGDGNRRGRLEEEGETVIEGYSRRIWRY